MNRGPVIFFGAFSAFALSLTLGVLAPQLQLGRQALTKSTTGDEYPVARPGQAAQGALIYRAQGCAACHSQQVRQDGIKFDVVLNQTGTNLAGVGAVLEKYASKASHDKVPVTVLEGLTDKAVATAAVKELSDLGAKAAIAFKPYGPDITRNYGLRRTVAADYLFDNPVQLGSLRLGPDLANIGARMPDARWHLAHLYRPSAVVKGSLMPPYGFLFTTRKVKGAPSADAVEVKDGNEVVPTDEARALVAYLLSLKVVTPLAEAPVTPPPAPAAAETNSVSAK